MNYLTEFRREWRALTAGIVGMAAGLGYVSTTASVFAPALLKEFGWSKAEFALTGSLVLILVIAIPLAGRITDMIGVRRTALIGTIALPAACLAFTAMTGDIRQYLALFVVQIFLGATTTATVWCRILVDHFRQARGLALAIGASGATISGAVITPLLNELVDAYGWRAGYQALAAFIIVAGGVALLLIPRSPTERSATPAKPRRNKEDYAAIARMPVFWLLMIAIFLCNLPLVLSLTQLKLLLQDNGMSGTTISVMLSTWSIGAMVGRLTCGVALDRFPMHIVAAIGMSAPAVGLFMIASPYDAPWLLALAVFLFGLSWGAEGDVMGYIVARTFSLAIFSTVLGLLSAMMSSALAVGAAVLSLTLRETGHFALFLWIAGAAVLVGGSMFLLLGRHSSGKAAAEPQLV